MLHLFLLVLSIGLADSMNPSSIGPALYLASGAHPRRSILEVAGGYSAVLLVGGLLLALGPGRAILALVPSPSQTTRNLLEIIAGAAMLVTAAYLWVRRRRLSRRNRKSDAGSQRRSPPLMGATISAVELPTAFPYFAAIAAIVGSGLDVGSQILLVVIYDGCFIIPLLAIAGALALAGDRALSALDRARGYMHRRWPVFAAAVALVAGLGVVALGVSGLRQNGHAGSKSASRTSVSEASRG
ncbi:MAG: GAP family protein [Solirubrobacteraceae bacterium]